MNTTVSGFRNGTASAGRSAVVCLHAPQPAAFAAPFAFFAAALCSEGMYAPGAA